MGAALLMAAQAVSAREWEWRNPLPQGADIQCLAGSEDDGLLGVVDHGGLLRSEDGTHWTVALNALDRSWQCNALTRGNGRWLMAVNAPGNDPHQVLMSDDAGRTWRAVGEPALLRDIVWHAGRFLAVGTSTAGNGTTVSHILESTTGEGEWTVHATLSGTLHGMAAGVDRFVIVGAGGAIYVSANKQRWLRALSGTTAHLRHVRFREGLFVAIGDNGTIVSSTDGLFWNAHAAGVDSDLQGLAAGPDGFAAVGDGGALLTSADGRSWRAQRSDSVRALRAVTAFGPEFIGAGAGGDLYRGAGDAWTPLRSQSGGARSGALHDLVGGPPGLVGVGADGLLLFSPDGVDWEMVETPIETALRGVTYGQGHFLAVGARGRVLLSPDGREWEAYSVPGRPELNGVAWRGGEFVAVGDNGAIARSRTGTQWERVADDLGGQDLIRVRAGAAGWVALARQGTILYSPDGEAWEPRALREGYEFVELVHAGARFLAVGRDDAASVLVESADGRLWEERSELEYLIVTLAPAGNGYLAAATAGPEQPPVWLQFDDLGEPSVYAGTASVHRLVASGGALFALGPHGAILQSGRFTPPAEPSASGEERLASSGGCAIGAPGAPDAILLLLLVGGLAYLGRLSCARAHRRRSSMV
ncbi:hypothetical protein HUS23_01640 [Ectothiorhodospiraceae bacterium 2226]|nr:hypothetical protein HUS23_01640 [Ectothiorhodospiraceae bacterium 2226]